MTETIPEGTPVRFTSGPLGLVRATFDEHDLLADVEFMGPLVGEGATGTYWRPDVPVEKPTVGGNPRWHLIRVGEWICPVLREQFEVVGPCGCGVPNRANHHLHVVIGRDLPAGGTETSEVDIYVCDAALTDDTASLLQFDGHEGWSVLERTETRLR